MNLASARAIDAGAPSRTDGQGAVRAWLITLIVLVMAMVAVGGATRLTGSGLSITEWRPVTGAIPPLSEEAWLAEFAKYRAIPQYELVNRGMSIADFKFIYWWEWSHRQLGRLIGLVFFLPLLHFWWRSLLRPRFALALLGVGMLGGLQGAVGWIMVASGLEPGMTAVAPVRLSLHLTIASLILVALVWVATGLDARSRPDQDREQRSASFHSAAYAFVMLILVQIALGGLVAGSRAGLTYNTWPLMDGHLIPPADTLFSGRPLIENFVDNLALVQFNHRTVAVALAIFVLWHTFDAWRTAPHSALAHRASVLAGLCLAQVTLGIVTLVLIVPVWAGLAHQLLAMILLSFAVFHARRSVVEHRSAAAARATAPGEPFVASFRSQ